MKKKFDWRKYWEDKKQKQKERGEIVEPIILTSQKIGDLEIEIPLIQPPKNSR